MKKTTYNVIITEFDPCVPKIMRLLKTTSLNHAIKVADIMKDNLRCRLAILHQTVVVISYDRCDDGFGYRETVEYITN